MRLYKCWTSAREIELEVDEISFTYEREAQGPSAEAIAKAGESGGTGADGDENSKDNRANQRKAVREVKAKTTEALAKSALQAANSNMLEIRGYRTKLLNNDVYFS
eukprot:s3889_g4.t1